MREIKFEVWDPNTERMYKNVGIDTIGHYDFQGDAITEQEALVIRQYTGLKDKNGKEIYEGDVGYTRIVRYKGSERIFLSVVRCDRCFWDFYDKERDIPHEIWPDDQFEIIGNIYEHPHLLEGRDEA